MDRTRAWPGKNARKGFHRTLQTDSKQWGQDLQSSIPASGCDYKEPSHSHALFSLVAARCPIGSAPVLATC